MGVVEPNLAVQNALGTVGAVLWSVQIFPQLWKSYKDKSTEGLSSWMMAIWFFAGSTLAAYLLLQETHNIPLIAQPHAFGTLSAVSWAQCMRYGKKKSKTWTILFFFGVLICGAVVELAFYFGGKATLDKGNEGLFRATAVIASICIIVGFLPQLMEIWRFKAVIGISLPFLAVDSLGGIFSFLSLLYQPGAFDWFAGVAYALVVVVEVFIFILVPILNPVYYRRRRAAASSLEQGHGSPEKLPAAQLPKLKVDNLPSSPSPTSASARTRTMSWSSSSGTDVSLSYFSTIKTGLSSPATDLPAFEALSDRPRRAESFVMVDMPVVDPVEVEGRRPVSPPPGYQMNWHSRFAYPTYDRSYYS